VVDLSFEVLTGIAETLVAVISLIVAIQIARRGEHRRFNEVDLKLEKLEDRLTELDNKLSEIIGRLK
jgi:hypothetical protein